MKWLIAAAVWLAFMWIYDWYTSARHWRRWDREFEAWKARGDWDVPIPPFPDA